MKIFILSLSVLFLVSCLQGKEEEQLPEAGQEAEQAEKPSNVEREAEREIESIRAAADTLTEETESFLDSAVASVRQYNGVVTNNSDTKKTLVTLENNLKRLVDAAKQSYKVVRSARREVKEAIDEAGRTQGLENAKRAMEQLKSNRDKAKEIYDEIQATIARS